jgi:hypothetical protein
MATWSWHAGRFTRVIISVTGCSTCMTQGYTTTALIIVPGTMSVAYRR